MSRWNFADWFSRTGMRRNGERRAAAARAARRRFLSGERYARVVRIEALESRALLAALPPLGLQSWYRGEDNTLDFAGGNDGTAINGAGFAAGMVGRGFSFDGNDDAVRLN